MGSVAVGADHRDRYFVLFPQTLLILSVSQRMSAFIYEVRLIKSIGNNYDLQFRFLLLQGKLPLSGIAINRLEDTESIKNAFEISGPFIEKIVAVCQGPNEANKWVDLLSSNPTAIRNNIKRNTSSSTVNIPQPPPHVSLSFFH